MPDAVHVRRARTGEEPELAPLLFLAAEAMHLRLAGSRERALRVIAADLERNLLGATYVAEIGGRPVAAMVAFPYSENSDHARAYLRVLLARTPPWRWPSILWLHWRGHRRAPHHPVDCIYVDMLGTEPSSRRRGAARALLAEAERVAREAGLSWLALDTAAKNHAALALYGRAGFTQTEQMDASGPIPRTVCLVKELG